jgi:hypothetical protein
MMPGYALTLLGGLLIPQRPLDVTKRLANWRRSIMRRGGYWLGTADYQGNRDEMTDMYLTGMSRRLVENTGGGNGAVTWEGMAAEMTLTLDGISYKRSMLDMMNAAKVYYTKISNNLITNPSVETNPWAGENGPATLERTTDWATLGDYSMHCITNFAPNDEGMEIQNTIAIEAEVAYQCRISVNVVIGTWVLKIKDQATDATIAKCKSSGTGDQIMVAEIGEENTVTSVRVILIGKTADLVEECYADNCIFSYAPVKAETTWYSDAASIADYGRMEDILLEPERTNAEAIAQAQMGLAARAWPRSAPPPRMEMAEIETDDKLTILFAGYVFSLNWLYINTTTGEAEASTHVASLVGESEFVTAGHIQENTMLSMVDADYPTRIWDKIKEIINAGDESQNRWEGGVYTGRQFEYQQTPTTLRYYWRGGRLFDTNSREVPPWEARPALTRIESMPVGPAGVSGGTTDDPRNIYLEGVEFIAPDRVVILPDLGREVR